MYLTGSQAEEAANWLFTGQTNKGGDKYDSLFIDVHLQTINSLTNLFARFQDRLHLRLE